MKQSHLKTWFSNFPNLIFLLGKEDRAVLDTIDPQKYVDFNLTRESEVIRIINDHKPQAWKWVRLYPSLKDLPAEDYAILDHIVPNDFAGEVTESDIRRIIAYRKENLRKKREEKAEGKVRDYYRNHAEEIAKEEKDRSLLSEIPFSATIIGTAFTSAGVAMWGTTVNPVPYLVIGIPAIVVPWLACSLALKRLDRNSLTPRLKMPEKVKTGPLFAAFIGCFYAALIGLGILLGTLFVWERLGWGVAEASFWTGLLTIVGSAFLFIILAIAVPSRE